MKTVIKITRAEAVGDGWLFTGKSSKGDRFSYRMPQHFYNSALSELEHHLRKVGYVIEANRVRKDTTRYPGLKKNPSRRRARVRRRK